VGQTDSYQSLADYLGAESTTSASATVTDQVDLALDKVAQKIIEEIAALTAETIKENPEFQEDYVVAIIDDGQNREARVYSRAEILAAFEGTEEEKAKLAQSLDENPLLTYSSADNLPATSDNAAAQDLADKINGFLKTNGKLLNTLNSYGYNPFATEEA
jgi:hypothetical protein